jgi:hypothetical protein
MSEIDVVPEDTPLIGIQVTQRDTELNGLVQIGKVRASKAEVPSHRTSNCGEQGGLPAGVFPDNEDRSAAEIQMKLGKGSEVAKLHKLNLHYSPLKKNDKASLTRPLRL